MDNATFVLACIASLLGFAVLAVGRYNYETKHTANTAVSDVQFLQLSKQPITLKLMDAHDTEITKLLFDTAEITAASDGLVLTMNGASAACVNKGIITNFKITSSTGDVIHKGIVHTDPDNPEGLRFLNSKVMVGDVVHILSLKCRVNYG